MDSTTSSAAALSGPSARLSQRESEAKVRKRNNLEAARPRWGEAREDSEARGDDLQSLFDYLVEKGKIKK
jgi:hypothetical protein